MKTHCVLLASGTGSRFGGEIPKQFVKVNGRMIIEYALAACDCGVFDQIILVVSEQYIAAMKTLTKENGYSIPVDVVSGGASRIASCQNGVAAIGDSEGVIVIHNGVQPFVKRETLEACIKTLDAYPVAISAIPCTYTILQSEDGGKTVGAVLDRRRLYSDMGVEGFRIETLRRVFAGMNDSVNSANLVGLASQMGIGPIGIFDGDPGNIKITYPEDVRYAELKIEGVRL